MQCPLEDLLSNPQKFEQKRFRKLYHLVLLDTQISPIK